MFILTNWISTTTLGYLHRLLIPSKRERPHVDWESSHPIFFDGFATCHFHSTWQRWDEHAWTMLKPSSNGTTKKTSSFSADILLIRTWRLPPLWYHRRSSWPRDHPPWTLTVPQPLGLNLWVTDEKLSDWNFIYVNHGMNWHIHMFCNNVKQSCIRSMSLLEVRIKWYKIQLRCSSKVVDENESEIADLQAQHVCQLRSRSRCKQRASTGRKDELILGTPNT